VIRVRYAQDDLLRARDLDADVAAEALHRARHVRAAHGTWGIAAGFDVTLLKDRPAAAVEPGLAYDACGGEIVSGRRRFVPAPAGASASVVELTVAAGQCGTRLWWRDPGAPLGDGVPLARARVGKGMLTALDLTVRRGARPLVGGRAGSGSFEIELTTEQSSSVAVDTSSFGFRTIPAYVITLAEGSPDGLVSLAAWRATCGPLIDVQNETATGFDVALRIGVQHAVGDPRLPADMYVKLDWLGVEAPEPCGPVHRIKEHR
jgi:hypothetical protein